MAGRKKQHNFGPINYERPQVTIRTRQGKPKYEFDTDEADRLLAESLDEAHGGLAHASPKGVCYDCDKKIPPGRKLCGICLAKRAHERSR